MERKCDNPAQKQDGVIDSSERMQEVMEEEPIPEPSAPPVYVLERFREGQKAVSSRAEIFSSGNLDGRDSMARPAVHMVGSYPGISDVHEGKQGLETELRASHPNDAHEEIILPFPRGPNATVSSQSQSVADKLEESNLRCTDRIPTNGQCSLSMPTLYSSQVYLKRLEEEKSAKFNGRDNEVLELAPRFREPDRSDSGEETPKFVSVDIGEAPEFAPRLVKKQLDPRWVASLSLKPSINDLWRPQERCFQAFSVKPLPALPKGFTKEELSNFHENAIWHDVLDLQQSTWNDLSFEQCYRCD